MTTALVSPQTQVIALTAKIRGSKNISTVAARTSSPPVPFVYLLIGAALVRPELFKLQEVE